jgi:hypothetical protein
MSPFRLSHGAIAEDSEIAELKTSVSANFAGGGGFYLCNLTSDL